MVNLTGVAGNGSTFLSLFPTNSSGQCPYGPGNAPSFSTINLLAGAVQANRVMVALGPSTTGGPDDALCVYNAVGTINVLVDANGWFGSARLRRAPPAISSRPCLRPGSATRECRHSPAPRGRSAPA